MSGPRRSTVPLLALAGAAALAIRIAVLWTFPGNFDSKSFGLAARTAARGGDLYDGGVPYNYAPVWAQALRGLASLGEMANVDLIRMIGLTLTAADLVTAFLVYRLCRERLGRHRAALAGLIFFANPVSVLLSSYHGQFDNVSILFLLAALLLVRREKAAGAAASLSLALCVKHITWFHPLLFAVRRRPRISLALAAAPYVAFLASFLPYRESWRSIRGAVFGYRAHTTIYGVDWLVGLFPGLPRSLPTILFVAAMAAAVLLLGLADVEIARASLILMLVQLVFLPGFGRQYCVWPIALGALFPSPGYLLYTLVGAGFLMYWLPDWNGTWFSAIFWLGWEISALLADRSRKRNSETPRILLAGA
jgi:hypothetical protein